MKHTELLTQAERDHATQIAGQITQTADYQLARQFIDRAHLMPTKKWKTCTVDQVRAAMLGATGIVVAGEAMALALADAGFVARLIDGEPSTNVRLRSFPKRGARIELARP